MLSLLTTTGNVGVVLEYGDEGVASLSVPERATIANMGAEMGVTASIFPSDDATRRFLKAQGREEIGSSSRPTLMHHTIASSSSTLAPLSPLSACPIARET